MTALVYILLCLIWGSTWLAIKIGLSQAPPLLTASLRFLLAMTILILIAKVNKYSFPRAPGHLLRLGYPGLYMYGVSYALIYLAEQRISSALTAILFGSFPFFVALLSLRRLKHERLPWYGWFGLVIGFAGVTLISYDSKLASGDLFLGSLLAIGGSFAAAWGMIIHKQHFVKENIVVATSVQMMVGGVLLVLSTCIFERPIDLHLSAAAVASIAYLAIFGTVVTFLGYYWLLRRMTAVRVSSIAFITPMVAVFVGVVFGGETLSTLTIVGTVLILSGIAMIIRRQPVAA
ncbi:MAG: hypothetical protein D6800_05970 [Candidatus Zixiibacteriota bacterium]|nr:MAG: hypothetical protein D6800_05970 [candidate division Zixibacteria bacterium]